MAFRHSDDDYHVKNLAPSYPRGADEELQIIPESLVPKEWILESIPIAFEEFIDEALYELTDEVTPRLKRRFDSVCRSYASLPP